MLVYQQMDWLYISKNDEFEQSKKNANFISTYKKGGESN
jgi:hypothetical protein